MSHLKHRWAFVCLFELTLENVLKLDFCLKIEISPKVRSFWGSGIGQREKPDSSLLVLISKTWFSSCDPFCTESREAADRVATLVWWLSWGPKFRSSVCSVLIVANFQGRPAILPLVVAKANPN